MAYRDLRDFIHRLESLGELRRIRVEVDPVLEMAEIVDRACKQPNGGKALLFERVKGSQFPVVANLYGSDRRMALALGVESLDGLEQTLDSFLTGGGVDGDRRSPLRDIESDSVTQDAPPCRQVVDHAPDLTQFPFLKSWPGDGSPDHEGRFITLPLVFTRHPVTGAANCGMYRVAILGRDRAAIRWHAGSGGDAHYREHASRRERMPVAIALGGDPVLAFTAMLPLPENLDEMLCAGALRGSPVEMVRCLTNDILVPAAAELVIEGFIEPDDTARDGAFGNHTGFYADPADAPAVHVTCVTHRRGMILPATVVGRPPMEDCYMARAAWRLLLPAIRRDVPEIADVGLPLEGIFHGAAIISAEKSPAIGGRELINRLWKTRWFGRSRLIVLVDAGQDVHDHSGIAWLVMNSVDWSRDLIIDPAPENLHGTLPYGGKLGIDATRESGSWPRELLHDEATRRLVDTRWQEYEL